MIRSGLVPLALSVMLAVAPASAQEGTRGTAPEPDKLARPMPPPSAMPWLPPEVVDSMKRDLRDGLEKLMRAFQTAVQTIPQYELPQMNERGDIIIRRKDPPIAAPTPRPPPRSEREE